MIKSQFTRATLVFATTIAALAGCSLTEAEPDGSDLAVQSCSIDLLPISTTSQIVPIGISKISLNSQTDKNIIQSRAEVNQTRSILSAKAAATNKYWQPLADAWALEEAYVRAALKSLESDKIPDDTGSLLKIDTGTYDKFVANVNIDFAAVTKNTYCRIAFVKQNIEIKYEN